MQQSSAYTCFMCWHQTIVERSRHAHLLHKAAFKMKTLGLSRALLTWQESLFEKQQAKRLERIKSMLQSRFKRGSLDAAVCKWARYSYRKSQLGHAAVLIKKMQCRLLVRRAWQLLSLLGAAVKERQLQHNRDTLLSNLVKLPRRNVIFFTRSFVAWAKLMARYRALYHAASVVSRNTRSRIVARSFFLLSHNEKAQVCE